MTDQTRMESNPKKMTSCPLCRFPVMEVGRLVAFEDVAGMSFSFAVCSRCARRLDRLPVRLQAQQLDAALRNLAKHPDRYDLRPFDSAEAARLFVALEAARLRGKF